LKQRGRGLVCFLITLMLFNAYLPIVAAFASFDDISEDYWAYSYIKQLQELGFAKGDGDGAYQPESYVTNAEFTALVCRMTGMDDTVLAQNDDWSDAVMEYARYMGWFTSEEIAQKECDEPIRRETAAKILMLGFFEELSSGEPPEAKAEIPDLSDVSAGCSNHVVHAYSMGIITGYPDGSFMPKALITRAEMAAIMCRAWHIYDKNPETGESVTVPILIYHHFSDRSGDTSPQKFRDDMEALSKAGYTTVFLDDLYNFAADGTKLPEKAVVVTIDDGYLSNYQYAYPVLKELGMKAEIAVIGWSVGLDKDNCDQVIIPHFSWEQASEMVDSGIIRIRSHSYNMHEFSSDGIVSRVGALKRDDESYGEYIASFVEDMKKISSLIRLKLGYNSNVFVYPYGESTPLTEKLLESLGYDITLTTGDGVNVITRGDMDTLRLLKRINADGFEGDIVRLIEKYY